jgi:YbbR domain-containing protein
MKKNIIIFFSIFVLSMLLWVYLSLNLFYTITLIVPLDVNVAKSQALASKIPPSIYVTVKGKGWDLVGLLISENLTYNLDLTGVKKDIRINTFQAVTERLNVPHDVEILNTYPDTVRISFDKVQKKRVRVRNNINVILKEGYKIIGNPKIIPDSVKITGAKSILSEIKYIPTETKTFENINESISVVVRLSDTLSNLIRIEPQEVIIEYDVELSAEKSYEDLSIVVYNVPSDKDVLLIPPKLKLSLRGGVEQLSQINPSEIIVGIEYIIIESDTLGFVTPVIELPINVDIINFEPQKFQYIIKKKY